MVKKLLSYVEFRSGEVDGHSLKGQNLAEFYDDTSYIFHPKFQMLRESLESTGILIPQSLRKEFKCVKIYLGDTSAYQLFIKAFKEVYIPRSKGFDVKWVDVTNHKSLS